MKGAVNRSLIQRAIKAYEKEYNIKLDAKLTLEGNHLYVTINKDAHREHVDNYIKEFYLSNDRNNVNVDKPSLENK